MIGVKKGTVCLCAHETEWEAEAARTVARLRQILGAAAKDIEHVGSTAIPGIKAKPIIDIAVAVNDFSDVLALEGELRDAGFYYCSGARPAEQLLFARGSCYDGTGDLQTHFIHVVRAGSMDWINYIVFREYLNHTPAAAKAYEDLKLSLAASNGAREQYTEGKQEFIAYTLRKALVWWYLGKTVTIEMDRPIGTVHPKHPDIVYPINYGYIPGVLGGDGEELDVYLLGVDTPVTEYTARIIGVVHRHNDVEDKLVAAPEGMCFTNLEIAEAVQFQEQYYESHIEALYERSCGTVLYTVQDGVIHYLLIRSPDDSYCGFPKGHMERGENETETALRETWEETSIRPAIDEGFRRQTTYVMPNGKTKTVVYFLGSYAGQTPEHNEGFESNEYLLLPYGAAYEQITYENAKEILKEANAYLET